MLSVVQGDLFYNHEKWVKHKTVVIPHVCNNRGAWGAGFVIPLSGAFSCARQVYLRGVSEFHKEHAHLHPDQIRQQMLGRTQFFLARNEPSPVYVANMIAQDLEGGRRLWYNKLSFCMDEVAYRTSRLPNPVIFCPMFGCGLAGGSWDVVKELIADCWIRIGLDVIVFDRC